MASLVQTEMQAPPAPDAGDIARPFFLHPLALAESASIGAGTRVWAFAHVMAGAEVGSDCNLGEHAFIESGACIGSRVTVKNGVSVWAGVHVEDDAFLGPHCVFTNDPNPRAYIRKGPAALVETHVRQGATIGAGAVIVCGHEIGRCAFVGAGAVVIRDVPDFALVVGNPARQIGWMCLCAEKLPAAPGLAPGARCQCAACGSEFEFCGCRMTVVCNRSGLLPVMHPSEPPIQF
ncbi:MAG TPA: acyltransferase [Terracidiphilus sp.]|nr:acyltransferase [Terracidiphilus sp.]